QRLMMMYAWKAMEDAGVSAGSLAGTSTAIFIGTAGGGYSELIFRANMEIEAYSIAGIAPSVGPNRMSYFLDIHGPSEPVETACSSSLVALHRAAAAIETGACEMAIAGGVNTMLTPDAHISFSKAGMLSRDGRCKTFSDQADGYVRAEGVGMLFLKKLEDALRSGDHIYGVIKGGAENHGGRANSLTAPNPKAQAELLKTVYAKSGVDIRTVGYIEAHGTGTKLGDPIETDALKAAFKELGEASGDSGAGGAYCGLGSVKTNIGHTELAAGIAGVIKVLLQMKYGTLVRSLHCDRVNPYLRLEDSPFYIVRENRKWESLRDSQDRVVPRRAGISSFGFGGVNAHVILEEYVGERVDGMGGGDKMDGVDVVDGVDSGQSGQGATQYTVAGPASTRSTASTPSTASTASTPSTGSTRSTESVPSTHPVIRPSTTDLRSPSTDHRPYIIVLSAKTEERLKEYARNLLAWLQRQIKTGQTNAPQQFLSSISYTLQLGRDAMEERLAMVVASVEELREKLASFTEGRDDVEGLYK
ncbi:MAG: polyketide synthase, partial [Desulfobacterales bacterium]|nr:polyketide synthase [Desulfobacterales bacterium]